VIIGASVLVKRGLMLVGGALVLVALWLGIATSPVIPVGLVSATNTQILII